MGSGRDPRRKPGNDKPTAASRRRFQFGLGTLFVVMTIFAVASAGFANDSIRGALVALLGAWTTLIGCLLIWGAVVGRHRTSLFSLLVGLGYVFFGAAMWAWSVS